jgi:hypothetical protein
VGFLYDLGFRPLSLALFKIRPQLCNCVHSQMTKSTSLKLDRYRVPTGRVAKEERD